jgi:hypothetical protein
VLAKRLLRRAWLLEDRRVWLLLEEGVVLVVPLRPRGALEVVLLLLSGVLLHLEEHMKLVQLLPQVMSEDDSHAVDQQLHWQLEIADKRRQ